MYNLLLVSCALSLARLGRAQGTISLTPLASVPSGAPSALDPSFAGFGIEPSHLFAFTGGDEVNQLSVNLLQNLADYTGKPPHLRIGGNAGDYIVYQSDFDGCECQVNPDATQYSPNQFFVGPCYFKALDRFPTGTPITYGLNMALDGDGYLDTMVEAASAARDGLTNVNLVSFEVGNEPDLYLLNGFRKLPWNGDIYTQQWLERANAVYERVLKGNIDTSKFFEAGCTASTTGQTSNGTGATFQIDQLISDGITINANSSTQPLVSGFNQHDYYYYIGVSGYQLDMDIFTDLWTMTNQFTAWYAQLGEAHAAGYPYYLREMGMVGPIGMAGISDTFSASLWTLNFFLYAATIGIAQVNMHMTFDSNASAWQPIAWGSYTPQPHVRPIYYGYAAMAQIIGKECSTQVTVMNITHTDGQPPSYDNRIVGYNSYKSGKLASIILINSMMANESEASKPSLTFNIHLPDFAGEKLYLSYLTADGSDVKNGTLWNGTSYELSGDGTATKVDDTVKIATIGSDGIATFTVRNSQAVVANIGSFVGTGELNASACAAFAAVTPTAQSSAAGLGVFMELLILPVIGVLVTFSL